MVDGPSFQDYETLPSALIWDGGAMIVPIFAVTELTLDETFHLPAIGSQGFRAVAPVTDTSVRLKGVLTGKLRYTMKLALETLAESAQRGSVVAAATGAIAGAVGAPNVQSGGLVLVTGLTIRTDMQIKSLGFTATASRRETLDVTLNLEHLPRPSSFMAKALDLAAVGVGALTDLG
jgi:hypothetical protein